MTLLMEIFVSTENFGILHAKYFVLVCVHTCRNEVIVERYRILNVIKHVAPTLVKSILYHKHYP